ncbi:M23 family metallopeptidase [Agromyces atrinae]|uniref:M23 family metallopeptidase n=1 Tax=Agromyces atrinae TaxID=592376 RepID=UPI001F5AC31D|nr:M23 family metallopeptidase [Agromyces atrinae]MCI2958259.1 M23 family metallopeptidase [Agromyces atrinae]
MSNLQRCYSRPLSPFGAKGPFWDPVIGHRGYDYGGSRGAGIVAYDDMVVEYVGRSTGLGIVMGLRRLTMGGFAGYAHVLEPMPVGSLILRGQGLGRIAGRNDGPGTLWDGAHIHTTLSWVSAFAAAHGNTPLDDPHPWIVRALKEDRESATAGGEGTIITPPKEQDVAPVIYPYQKTGKWQPKVGETLRMQNDSGTGTKNLVPRAGIAIIATHVYLEKLELGDAAELTLKWVNKDTGRESPHYVERIEGTADGIVKSTITFARNVAPEFIVVADIKVIKGAPTITLTGADVVVYPA